MWTLRSYLLRQCLSHTGKKCSQSHLQFSRSIHPLLWVSRITSIVTARVLRRKWRALPANEKLQFKQQSRSFAYRHRFVLSASGCLFGGLLAYREYQHTDTTVVTQRRRRIHVSGEQLDILTRNEEKMIESRIQGSVIPTSSGAYKQIEGIVVRLLRANQDLECIRDTQWKLTVVDSKECNAFVLPNGHIFVFGGIIEDFVRNTDQLSFLLSHEIAHVVLKHSAEKVSKATRTEFMEILAIFLLFLGLPDISAFFFSLITPFLTNILLNQPYSRQMELEADKVGLQLSAKACFDIREAAAMWRLVALKMEVEAGGAPENDFLSTHPSFGKRADQLNALIHEALQIRASRHCKPVGGHDPVRSVEHIRRQLQGAPIAPGTKLEILPERARGDKAVRLTQRTAATIV